MFLSVVSEFKSPFRIVPLNFSEFWSTIFLQTLEMIDYVGFVP